MTNNTKDQNLRPPRTPAPSTAVLPNTKLQPEGGQFAFTQELEQARAQAGTFQHSKAIAEVAAANPVDELGRAIYGNWKEIATKWKEASGRK